jgi:5'(3')-deoxyribonucleotidase
MYNDKVILTDVDGVLLNWFHSFNNWMNRRHDLFRVSDAVYNIEDVYGITKLEADSLIIMFNESASIGSLPPLRDAMKYIKKLHEEHGYVLHCITAVADDQFVKMLRLENLERLFGSSVVERLECVGTSKDKLPILSEYKGSGLPWIEDMPENAKMGSDLGLVPYLMDFDYNSNYENNSIIRVKNWKEIYEALT